VGIPNASEIPRRGIDAGIAFLKRTFRLSGCNWSGFDSFSAYAWGSVLSCNLLVLAGNLLVQEAASCRTHHPTGTSVEGTPAPRSWTRVHYACVRPPLPPPRARILVVDDEPNLAKTLAILLDGHTWRSPWEGKPRSLVPVRASYRSVRPLDEGKNLEKCRGFWMRTRRCAI
jgi:hypothetical protein